LRDEHQVSVKVVPHKTTRAEQNDSHLDYVYFTDFTMWTPNPAVAAALIAAFHSAIDAAASVATYAKLVHANYQDTLSGAQALQQSIRAFTPQAPTTLDAARNAWLKAQCNGPELSVPRQ
jgi:uncharacterized iron-regulated protein